MSKWINIHRGISLKKRKIAIFHNLCSKIRLRHSTEIKEKIQNRLWKYSPFWNNSQRKERIEVWISWREWMSCWVVTSPMGGWNEILTKRDSQHSTIQCAKVLNFMFSRFSRSVLPWNHRPIPRIQNHRFGSLNNRSPFPLKFTFHPHYHLSFFLEIVTYFYLEYVLSKSVFLFFTSFWFLMAYQKIKPLMLLDSGIWKKLGDCQIYCLSRSAPIGFVPNRFPHQVHQLQPHHQYLMFSFLQTWREAKVCPLSLFVNFSSFSSS